MANLNPYLRFNGNCKQAMEFYRDCLGGKLDMMTMGESPMAAQIPPQMKNRVMHSYLAKDAMALMASDMMADEKIVNGNSISICISGSSKKEIEYYFSKLSQGGKVNQPLKQEFFGTYGDLTDKFGVHWMFQADNPK